MDISQNNLIDSSELIINNCNVVLEFKPAKRFENTFTKSNSPMKSNEIIKELNQARLLVNDLGEMYAKNEHCIQVVFETEFLARRFIRSLNNYITRRRVRNIYKEK